MAPAIADFDQAISHDPNYANAYSARALSWEAKGNHKLAEADREKALSLGAK